MNPKICASVTGRSFAEVGAMICQAEHDGADLAEIRFDYLTDRSKPEDIRALTELPLIATNRLQSHGGLSHDVEEKRLETLLIAADSGYQLVDVELDTPNVEKLVAKLRGTKAKVLLSWHSENPLSSGGLESKFTELSSLKPDICKIVTMANSMEDNLACLGFLTKYSRRAEVVCFCMGSVGRISRVLSPLFGSAFIYASTAKGSEAAAGQFTVAEMKSIYEQLGV